MESKRQQVLEAMFNTPKIWTFTELLGKSGVSRPQLAMHLKRLQKERVVTRRKPRGHAPEYEIRMDEKVKQRKALLAQQRLHECGLMDALAESSAKVAIVFGSYSRWDWYDDSDVDVFLYGEGEESFEQYERRLKRAVQVHQAKDKEELVRMEHLLPHILQGIFVKGSVNDLGVTIAVRN